MARVSFLALLLLATPAASEDGFRLRAEGLVDLRMVRADDTTTWLDGGLGKLRLGGVDGEGRAVPTLAQASVVVRADLDETLRAFVQANVDTGSYRATGLAGIDLVEAWASFRPRLSDTLGLRLKAGHFFPPLSVENDGIAWTATRTLTASALNSWIGEEVRVTGLETSVELFLPTSDLALSGAVFGGNDPTGSLLAWRGWAVGDRQTGLSDRLPLAPLPTFERDGIFPLQDPWVAPFREVDGRAGWYAAISWRLPERLEVRALRYDNRGDLVSVERGQYAWKTAFLAAEAGLRLAGGVELLGGWLDGRCAMGPEEAVDASWRTWFVLGSLDLGAHRLSVRWERFDVRDEDRYALKDPNGEDGEAWTAAFRFEAGRQTSVFLEVVSVDATRPARVFFGLPSRARETIFQVAVRGRF